MALARSLVRVVRVRQPRVLAVTVPRARVTTPLLLRRVCPVLVALARSLVRVVRVRQPRVLAVTVPRAPVARARRVVAALARRARVLPVPVVPVPAVTALPVLVARAPAVTAVRVLAALTACVPLQQPLVPAALRAPTRA